jgi:hypothetical protein
MKKIVLVLMAAAILMLTSGVRAGEEKSFQKGIVVSEADSITAVVEEIDYQARTARLRGPQGGSLDLKVDERAKNFDQVKKGDTVTLGYYASLLLKLQKPTEAPASAEASAMQIVPKGQKPKVVKVETYEGVVTIEGINVKDRTITVRNPKNEVKTHAIGTDVTDFDKLKVGDQIYYSYTQAVSLEVKKPKGKP